LVADGAATDSFKKEGSLFLTCGTSNFYSIETEVLNSDIQSLHTQLPVVMQHTGICLTASYHNGKMGTWDGAVPPGSK
jgi:hypothetical protein